MSLTELMKVRVRQECEQELLEFDRKQKIINDDDLFNKEFRNHPIVRRSVYNNVHAPYQFVYGWGALDGDMPCVMRGAYHSLTSGYNNKWAYAAKVFHRWMRRQRVTTNNRWVIDEYYYTFRKWATDSGLDLHPTSWKGFENHIASTNVYLNGVGHCVWKNTPEWFMVRHLMKLYRKFGAIGDIICEQN